MFFYSVLLVCVAYLRLRNRRTTGQSWSAQDGIPSNAMYGKRLTDILPWKYPMEIVESETSYVHLPTRLKRLLHPG